METEPTIEGKTRGEYLDEMTALRVVKPRHVERMFGRIGPTPEQAIWHAQTVKDWNKKFNAARCAFKKLDVLQAEWYHRKETA